MMSGDASADERRQRLAVPLAASAVVLLVCLAYLPAVRNGFVNWDDDLYVNRAPLAMAVPTSFATFHASGNWHPLTNLSHALDHALFGSWPAGHHLTSLVLHGVNAGLVVLLTLALLGARAANGGSGRRPLVAGIAAGLLWGLHPLRVECVAWVSERKELLCAFFYLLGLLSYLRRARDQHGLRSYLAALVCMALALLCKPMAVSFPLVLLVLDAYPLARLRRPTLGRVLAEKIPFALLAGASAVVTFVAHQAGGAMQALAGLPLSTRLLVAAQSSVGYLGHTLWPRGLRALYAYPQRVSLFDWRFALPFAVLSVIVALCVKLARRQGAPAAAMASYLIALVPVIGVVQVGPQAMADRYTYLPSIALSVLAGAAVGVLWDRCRQSPQRWPVALFGGAAALLVATLACLSIRQISVWHDSGRLWTQVLAHDPGNVEAHNNRADFHYRHGDFEEALTDYSAALAGKPTVSAAHATKRRAAILNDRAITCVQLGRLDEAVADESDAIRLRPGEADYYANRARIFERMGRSVEANLDWQRAREMQASHGATSPISAPQSWTGAAGP